MLKNNEIIVGALYAWDVSVTEPSVGCNLFTITGLSNSLVDVDSIDGCISMRVGTYCFITEDSALKRLSVLQNIDIDKEADKNNFRRQSYDHEMKYLVKFETALNEYKKSLAK